MDPVTGHEHLRRLLQVVPGLVQRIGPEHVVLALPIPEGGGDDRIHGIQGEFFMTGLIGFALSPVIDAHVSFQEFHGAVHQPLSVPMDPDVPVVDDDPAAVFAEFFRGRFAQDDIAFANGHGPFLGFRRSVGDEEVSGEVQRLLLGCGFPRMGRNEPSGHFALVDDPHLRRHRHRRQRHDSQNQCFFHACKIRKKMQAPEGLHSISVCRSRITSALRRRR